VGNGVSVDRDAALHGGAQAWENERRRPPREAGAAAWDAGRPSRRGRPDANLTLMFMLYFLKVPRGVLN